MYIFQLPLQCIVKPGKLVITSWHKDFAICYYEVGFKSVTQFVKSPRVRMPTFRRLLLYVISSSLPTGTRQRVWATSRKFTAVVVVVVE